MKKFLWDTLSICINKIFTIENYNFSLFDLLHIYCKTEQVLFLINPFTELTFNIFMSDNDYSAFIYVSLFTTKSDNNMLNFVFIKGFGDFIIGAYFLKGLSHEDAKNIRILTTPRIAVLADVINLPIKLSVLDIPGTDAPALFEIKIKGLLQAIKSGVEIKNAIDKLNSQDPILGELIFDKISLREKYISQGFDKISLPKNNDNLYQAYDSLMRQLNLKTILKINASSNLNNLDSQFIGIFPISRSEKKDIPASVLHLLNAFLEREGKKPRIYLFEDQMTRYKEVKNITVIQKDFHTLIECMRSNYSIISADSLPAHLAQYFNIPVFVMTRRDNHYWLPIESFKKGSHCNFGDILSQSPSSLGRLRNFMAAP